MIESAPELARDPLDDLVERDWYRDPEIFALERDRLFRRVWHFGCLTFDIPNAGDYFTLTVAEQPILIVRGKDQVVRAFLNACSHRGTALTEDSVGASGNCGLAFRCMYHAWSYDTQGALIGVPHEDAYGPDFDRSALGLVPVQCETLGSFVFVALDPLRPTLREFMGEALEWMEPAVQNVEALGRASWIYNGNWKLWHENFRDNYHPPIVHRTVRDLTPNSADGGFNYGLRPGHSLLRWPLKQQDYERYDRALKHVSGLEVESRKALPRSGDAPNPWRNIIAFFPNLDYQQPAATAVGLQICNPLTVDTARIDIIYLGPIDEDPTIRTQRLRYAARTTGCWGETSVDDCEAAERTTIGLGSRGTRYTNIARGTAPGTVGEGRDEYSLREFYREYRHYLFA